MMRLRNGRLVMAGATLTGAAFMFATAGGILWEVLPDFGLARRPLAMTVAAVAVMDTAWAIWYLTRS